MWGDGALTFREFAVREPLPLATIHAVVLEFLRGRDDVAVFGAQGVNAYVKEPRMTQDVDLVSTRAPELARELREHLSARFHVAIRVRKVASGRGFRIDQVQKPANRHLVDVHAVSSLPATRRIEKVLVVDPTELVAGKVLAWTRRRGTPKSFLDRRDLAALLLAFPKLKTERGAVRARLVELHAEPEALSAWSELVREPIRSASEDDEF
jgi:hypothetical protein